MIISVINIIDIVILRADAGREHALPELARLPLLEPQPPQKAIGVKIGTVQRILAWPLRKDDTHKLISVNTC